MHPRQIFSLTLHIITHLVFGIRSHFYKKHFNLSLSPPPRQLSKLLFYQFCDRAVLTFETLDST